MQRNTLLVLFLIMLILSSLVISAAEPEIPEDNDVLWTVVPGPFYNPNLGVGIQILPLVSYPLDRTDDISPPSVTAGFLLFAKPDWDIPEWTFIGGVGQKLYWAEDDWRANAHIGGASVVFQQYFAGNQPGDNNQHVWAIMDGLFIGLGAKRRIWNRLYGGLNYTFEYYKVQGRDALGDALLELIGYEPGVWQFQSMMGAELLWDSRDNQFASTAGILGQLKFDYGAKWLGGSNDYILVNGVYSQYYSFKTEGKHVLAWAYQVKSGFGDVPLDKYNSIGGGRGASLRGYVAGEFMDKSSMELQTEYRIMFTPRIGATAFVGVGTTFGVVNDFMQGPILPAGGFGFRYAMIPDRRINARLDFAWGIDSFSVYFALGEAF